MSDFADPPCLRWDAEDIAVGTPLSGADKLAERIEFGLYGQWAEGEEAGCKNGYMEAMEDIMAELDLSDPPEFDNDKREDTIKWIVKQIEEREAATVYNEALNAVEEGVATLLGTLERREP